MTQPTSTGPGPVPVTPAGGRDGARARASPRRGSLVSRLGLVRFSGVYGLILIVILFSLLEPSLFPTRTDTKLILVDSAVSGLLALGIVVPLSAGLLDLSFAYVAGFGMVFMAWASTRTGMNSFVLALLTTLVCGGFGVLSGVLVSVLELDSLIVTLGVGSLALGITQFLTAGNTMNADLSTAFQNVGLDSVGVVPILAVILFGVAAVLYVWLEHTTGGRFVLATGSNPRAARLAGVNVGRIQVLTLVVSSLVAGGAGTLLLSRVGSVTDSSAQGYLLPVIAAVFLGTTQIHPRPNVWGTVLAVYLLGTGVQGIQLEGNSPWVNSFFNGAVLLIAVTIGALRRRTRRVVPQLEK